MAWKAQRRSERSADHAGRDGERGSERQTAVDDRG